jgi:type II secretory ATPase GspE/PulE/Tfp pilus assembly ATPase PilB-like protein
LSITRKIQDLINARTPAGKIEEFAIKEEGMLLMRQDGMIKALKGLTTVEEVIRATKD